MSNLLSQVSHTSASQIGMRAVISGIEGSGKTTLACGAPKALLIPMEQGYAGMSCNATPLITTYDDLMSLIDEITVAAQKKQLKFGSLINDSATALERMIHSKVLQSDPDWKPGNPKGVTMGSALKGYGKAFDRANELFVEVLTKFDALATHAGINIIFTCHAFASKVLDPTAGEFNQWDLLLHSPKDNKGYGKREILCQWGDIVGFLHEPMFVSKNSESFSQGISANKGRILGIDRTPGYVAKNRYNMTTEIAIPKIDGWNYLADAIFKSSNRDFYNRG